MIAICEWTTSAKTWLLAHAGLWAKRSSAYKPARCFTIVLFLALHIIGVIV